MTSALEYVAGQPEMMNQLETKTPLGRVGEPEDIAAGGALPRARRPASTSPASCSRSTAASSSRPSTSGLPDVDPVGSARVTSAASTPRTPSRPTPGEHWTAEGAWEVAEGIHRIPLPLPMDGLKAINVYVIQTDDGLTLIDGGWAIPQAPRAAGPVPARHRQRVRRHPAVPGHPHPPRPLHDGHRAGPRVRRGRRARHRREARGSSCSTTSTRSTGNPFAEVLRRRRAHATSPRCGSPAPSDRSGPTRRCGSTPTPGSTATTRSRWARAPSTRCTRRATRPATSCSPTGPTACCSPATTCCRRSRRRSASPCPETPQPLGDFLASLTKVRSLPDLRILPGARPGGAVVARPGRRAARHHEHGSTCAWRRSPTGR